MATTVISQINYSGRGPLDYKLKPVEHLSDLNNIPRTERYKGLTVTVLDDGNENGPVDYWLTDDYVTWKPKMPSFDRTIDCGEY